VLWIEEGALPALTTQPLARLPGISASVFDRPHEITPAPAEKAPLEHVERAHIVSVLEKTNWTIEGRQGAAKILNLQPSTLRSRMQKLGIVRPTRGA
jgi:transcriptional regulator with GAF, ATPase, and Fis domain